MKKFIIAFFLMLLLLEEPRMRRRSLAVPAAVQVTTTLTSESLALSMMIFHYTLRARGENAPPFGGEFDLLPEAR